MAVVYHYLGYPYTFVCRSGGTRCTSVQPILKATSSTFDLQLWTRVAKTSSELFDFLVLDSYSGTAETMKKMLETSFPGIDVVLANYPPPLPKRVLSKLVPAVQMGVIGIIMAGEQIFPMLGFMVPPPSYYYSLLANRFGSIATTWLLGNDLQNFLQSTGAFEVYLNDEPVSVSALHQIFSFDFYWNEIYSAVGLGLFSILNTILGFCMLLQ
ncbi:hypothetical protein TEA_012547 [Camellia sinensis var. sinensis]|uniref:Uncharacterized protein n=1 Tax=Camellia sinensis var. sinensis TaxID=542762 RepID=A0A4S4DTV8_CAMSN|nr:hypothetical protein TEA_012547 [Camellia sinensis var. sinensis]